MVVHSYLNPEIFQGRGKSTEFFFGRYHGGPMRNPGSLATFTRNIFNFASITLSENFRKIRAKIVRSIGSITNFIFGMSAKVDLVQFQKLFGSHAGLQRFPKFLWKGFCYLYIFTTCVSSTCMF